MWLSWGVSITRCNLLPDSIVSHCGLIILWLSGTVFTPSLLCAGIILGAMTWHQWPGLIISQSEATVLVTWSILANQRPVSGANWPMRGQGFAEDISLKWRVDTAKGLEQDRVHYRIQMCCGELKIRNVNMGLVTLIRYSWSIFFWLVWGEVGWLLNKI